MPTVKNVQRQVFRREGFEIHFLYQGPGPTSGRDVRDDRTGLPSYPYLRASPDSTVADWIDRRFKATFPGFDVEVLKGDGSAADGRTKLSTVRSSYD